MSLVRAAINRTHNVMRPERLAEHFLVLETRLVARMTR